MDGRRRLAPEDLDLVFSARDWLTGDEPVDRVLRRWQITVVKNAYSDEPSSSDARLAADEVIGRGTASVASIRDAANARIGVIEALDAISAELEHLSVIYDDADGWWTDDLGLADPGPTALLLETLEFEPVYRGLGLGPAVLAGIIDRLGVGCSFAALEPHPIGEPFGGKPVDDAIRSLERLWTSVGFRPFRDGVWVLDLATVAFDERCRELLHREA